jgi:hypothetical protein
VLQYFNSQYTTFLYQNELAIRIIEYLDSYKSAVKERVNGILKDEFMLDTNFESYYWMKKQVNQAI